MRLTLIRHLPTEWNKKTWLQGKRDIGISPLTEAYQREVQIQREYIAEQGPFDYVLASSLKRTHQTAEIYGYMAKTEPLLDELDFGPFEGQPKKYLLDTYQELWIENPRALVLGEELLAFENRIVQFLEKYSDIPHLLLFGHGSWIRALISYKHYGSINHMNKLTVKNNQCLNLEFRHTVSRKE